MENLVMSTIQQRKSSKKSTTSHKKGKKIMNKPVKVVYISNPMKVKTSASEFRALVQELTGRDAEFPDPTKFPATHHGAAATAGDLIDPTVKMGSSDDDDDHHDDVAAANMNCTTQEEEAVAVQVAAAESSSTRASTTPNYRYSEGLDDDVFVPQMMMLDNYLSSSNSTSTTSVWYDSAQVDVIRSLNDALM